MMSFYFPLIYDCLDCFITTPCFIHEFFIAIKIVITTLFHTTILLSYEENKIIKTRNSFMS